MVMKVLRDASSGGLGKFILFGFLVLAVAGLALMDVGGFFRGGTGSNNVIRIKDKTVSIHEFDRTARRQLQALGLSLQEAYQMGYLNQVLATQIREILIADIAKESGFEIPQDRVAAYVSNLLKPLAQNGATPDSVLRQILQTQRMSESAFEDAIRGEMKTIAIQSALAPESAPNNQAVIDGLYQFEQEKRDIEYLKFHDSEIEIANPDEAALQQHYDLHREDYKIPETRAVEIVMLDESQITKDTSLDAAAILDKKLELAEQLEDLNASDLSLSEIASQMPVITTSVAELGISGNRPDQIKAPLPKDIAEHISTLAKEAFLLDEGESSVAIELPGAKFATVKVVSITPQSYHGLETVKKQIIESWKKEEQHNQTYQRVSEALDILSEKEMSFKDYADQNTRNYRTVDGLQRNKPTDPFDAGSLHALFKAPIGSKEILEIDGGYVLASVVKARAPLVTQEVRTSKAYTSLNNEMLATAGEQFLGTILDYEHNKSPAMINNALLERLYGQKNDY